MLGQIPKTKVGISRDRRIMYSRRDKSAGCDK